jgi:hypothetical protein
MLAGGLLSSIMVARVLGAEGLGALAVINVTVAIALQFGCAGLPSANTYFIARDHDSLRPSGRTLFCSDSRRAPCWLPWPRVWLTFARLFSAAFPFS